MVCYGAVVFAQGTGKIAGKVSDKSTGEPIIGAGVKIVGTSKAVATNVDGKFEIGSLTPGNYSIEVSFISFNRKQITQIEVKANEITLVNVALEEAKSILNQVTITATARQESTNTLYAKQKNSAVISDGVSSEQIRKSPDRSTSDVLKRVSGATIQDNKFVVIRGLSDRYNNATLDGASLPSTEPNRKAFSFDIVPSALVDNLIISKTATPDLPADFTGGAIQIVTKDIPDRNFITFGIGEGYNTASTFNEFKSGPRSGINYLGFSGSDRALPLNFPSSNKIINRQLTSAQGIAAMKSLSQDFNIYSSTALPTQNLLFSLGRVKSFKESSNKFGSLFSVTYRNAHNINNDVVRDYVDVDYRDNVYRFSTNFGAIANFAYSFGKSKISFKNIYNRTLDDNFLSRTGMNTATGGGADVKFYAFDLMQKALLKSTLEGNHGIGGKGAKISWSGSYSNILNDQPDQKKVSYYRNTSDVGSSNYQFNANVTTLGKENTRLFSKLQEDNYAASVNYSLPIRMFNQSATFKTGLNSLYRDRNFDARFLGFLLNTSLSNANQIRQRPLNTLFGSDLLNNGSYSLDEIPGDIDSYTANSMTNAAYVMLDNKFGAKSRLVWGLRVEQFKVQLKSKNNNPLSSVDDNYLDFLPSANYTYSLTPKINLRASYYRTLARPEFRELALSSVYDYELLAFQQGDPNLKEAKIDNADIRFEIYPKAGQIFSVSAFFKKFHNAIESFNNDGTSSRIITYINTDNVDVYGVELEFRRTLDFIVPTEFMKKTTFYTNLSLVKSKIEPKNTGINLLEPSRPMVGQAPYVLNAGLQHSFLNDKLSINALYNRVGRKLYIAGGVLFHSVWEQPRDVIDMQISAKFLKGKGELKFNAGDILNQKSLFYFDNDMDKVYNIDKGDFTLSSFRPGSNYSLSFTYTL